MLSERSSAYWQRAKWGEGLVILIGTPFLLFPERFILLTTITLTLLAAVWLAPIFFARDPLIPATPYNAAFLLFGITLCVGILVTADPEQSLPKATGLILGLAIWRYTILAIRQRPQVPWALGAYLVVGLGATVIGLANADWILKATSQVPLLEDLLAAPAPAIPLFDGGSGIHPNQIAGMITLYFPLLIALSFEVLRPDPAIWPDSRIKTIIRWAIILATVFTAASLLATQSRSAWLGAIGGLFVLLTTWVLAMKPGNLRRRMLTGIGLVLAASLILFALFIPRWIEQVWSNPPQDTAVGSLSTVAFRQTLWPWAVQAVNDFPFTGVGVGAFRQAARRIYPILIDPNYDFAHAHNFFLQTALDLGIPGLVAYGSILIISLAIAYQLARQAGLFRAYGAGLLASLAAFHIYGLTDAVSLGSKPSVLLWAIFGLLAAMIRLR